MWVLAACYLLGIAVSGLYNYFINRMVEYPCLAALHGNLISIRTFISLYTLYKITLFYNLK